MRVIAVLAFVLAGCQLTPTKEGAGTQRREFDVLVDRAEKPLVIGEKTAVLDARKSFDYGLNRIEGSLHLPWESLAESAASGEELRDPRKAGLKLSLMGLEPGSQVIVVGYGPLGAGEEGRVAWSLLRLGFQDVQVATADMFRKNWTQRPSAPRENVPAWPVNPRADLQIELEEFRKLAFDLKSRVADKIFVLDVRSEKEYFNRADAKSAPDIQAMNVPWTEFYTAKGRPNPKLAARLQALGIAPGDRVILISNKGVRSGAAAYALLALGFKHVQNFTGGWNLLLK